MDNSTGLMEAFIKENLKKIIWKEKVSLHGKMEEHIMVCGLKIKDMVTEECFHGLTVSDMKEILLIISKKAMVSYSGPTVENMLVTGRTDIITGLEHILLPPEKQRKENGKMDKSFVGFKIENILGKFEF